MEKQNGISRDEFLYQVQFLYNGQPYQIWLTSQKDLEVQWKLDGPRFIVDTIEGAAVDWLKSKKLLVDGVRLQGVCLHSEDGEFIANISKLRYE